MVRMLGGENNADKQKSRQEKISAKKNKKYKKNDKQKSCHKK
jgi:hypothetical protein